MVLRLAWATFGRVLFGRAAAIACGLGLVAAILFAPQGLRAADVVRWTDASLLARFCPWMLWLALAVPPVGAALRAPGTKILRTLPIATHRLVAIFFGFVLVLHLPWAIFFQRASGVMRATSSTLLAMVCVASLVAPIRFWPLAGVALACSLSPPIGIAVGLPLLVIAGHAAWKHGAEPRSVWTVPIPKQAVIAIATSFILVFVRRERIRALLAVAMVALGVAIGELFVDRPRWVLVPAIALAGGAIAPVLAREASRLKWIAPRAWLPEIVAVVLVLWAAPLYFLARKWTRGGSAWALAVVAYAVVTACLWRIAC